MSRRRLHRLVLLLLASSGLLACSTPPTYDGPVSPHFDGEQFFNQKQLQNHSFSDFLRWRWKREAGTWREINDSRYGPPPPKQGKGLRATFINHATVLIQTRDFNILTDPIWSERASPVSWAGPRRMRPPGIRFEDLPPIDVVIISHSHYDHMDLPTLKRLYERDQPLFLLGLGNASILHSAGIKGVRELDWWQAHTLSPDTLIYGVPAQHFSMRWLNDRNERLWMGFVIDSPQGPIYFAGDTGMGPHFEQIRERFGPIRLSMLPIGAYKPRWFMAGVHINPHEAVLAHKLLQSRTSIGIHFGTFPLADDDQFEPIRDLEQARIQEAVSDKAFRVMAFGEGREIP
ncbi:MAG: MBL fold metallo-hydrolase [Gammaproteobacteria bacterium]|nr:MBL fold metallo-hydrolase [Gammaproteobacteria bacterium]